MKINFFIFLFLFFPGLIFSKIIFSEIMYDPEGKDSGYEWVEIKNTYNFSVNLNNYKFCEGKPTCRNWDDNNENFELLSGQYAIITDDKEKFLEKNKNFEGLIFVVSNFVLSNSGEILEIRNEEDFKEDYLKYNTDSGGKNGNTLSLIGEFWKNSKPTPGKDNILLENEESFENESKNQISKSYIEISDRINGKKKIKAEINSLDTFMVGANSVFQGRAYGLNLIEISGVEFSWNFGDGSEKNGQKVYHIFDFPGEYIITLFVKSGNFGSEVIKKIKVIQPPIEITEVVENKINPGYLKLKNNSNEILSLGNWIIQSEGEKFIIPEKTYIDKKGEIIFSSAKTDLLIKDDSIINLYFPNGVLYKSFNLKKDRIKEVKEVKEEEKNKEEKNKEKTIKNNINKTEEKNNKNFKINKKTINKENKENEINNFYKEEIYKIEKKEEIILKKRDDFLKNNFIFFLFLSILSFLLFISFYLKIKGYKNSDTENNYEKFDLEAKKYKIIEIKN